MNGYELAFWIAVAVIAALILVICWPGRGSYPAEHPERWCNDSCFKLDGHRHLEDWPGP